MSRVIDNNTETTSFEVPKLLLSRAESYKCFAAGFSIGAMVLYLIRTWLS